MTDEDRYGRQLGRKFKAVRARLCSQETQAEAAAAAANYILGLLAKEIEDFEGLSRRLYTVIGNQLQLFGREAELDAIERSTNGSLGAQQFVEAARTVCLSGGSGHDLIQRFAGKAVDSTRECLVLRRGWRDDRECIAAFNKHAADIVQHLVQLLKRKCGIGISSAASKLPREKTESLLDFVVVRE